MPVPYDSRRNTSSSSACRCGGAKARKAIRMSKSFFIIFPDICFIENFPVLGRRSQYMLRVAVGRGRAVCQPIHVATRRYGTQPLCRAPSWWWCISKYRDGGKLLPVSALSPHAPALSVRSSALRAHCFALSAHLLWVHCSAPSRLYAGGGKLPMAQIDRQKLQHANEYYFLQNQTLIPQKWNHITTNLPQSTLLHQKNPPPATTL